MPLSWREHLKSGPFGGAYSLVRSAKRRMLGQPLAGYVPQPPMPLTVDQLHKVLLSTADHSRVHYSLGVAYLDRGLPGDADLAAACLRSAESLQFESPERASLQLARLAYQRGDIRKIAGLLGPIEAGELTSTETALRDRLLHIVPDPPPRPAPADVLDRGLALPHASEVPQVSVIVPNYNYARYIKERMRSILQQTWTDLEVLYVDDGSTDDSNRFAGLFATDPRVRIRVWEQNSGTVYQRWNEAAEEARGQWLWFANADDSAHPRFLERLLQLVRVHPEVAIAHTDIALIDKGGRLLSAGLGGRPEVRAHLAVDCVTRGEEEIIRLSAGLYLRTASAVLLRRDAFLEAGGFDTRLWGVADYDLYLKVLSKHSVAYAAEPLAYYREHSSNTTRLTSAWRLSLGFAYAFAGAYERMEGDPRFTPEMRSTVLRQTRAHVFDLFTNQSNTIPNDWRFAAERVYQLVHDRRLRDDIMPPS